MAMSRNVSVCLGGMCGSVLGLCNICAQRGMIVYMRV